MVDKIEEKAGPVGKTFKRNKISSPTIEDQDEERTPTPDASDVDSLSAQYLNASVMGMTTTTTTDNNNVSKDDISDQDYFKVDTGAAALRKEKEEAKKNEEEAEKKKEKEKAKKEKEKEKDKKEKEKEKKDTKKPAAKSKSKDEEEEEDSKPKRSSTKDKVSESPTTTSKKRKEYEKSTDKKSNKKKDDDDDDQEDEEEPPSKAQKSPDSTKSKTPARSRTSTSTTTATTTPTKSPKVKASRGVGNGKKKSEEDNEDDEMSAVEAEEEAEDRMATEEDDTLYKEIAFTSVDKDTQDALAGHMKLLGNAHVCEDVKDFTHLIVNGSVRTIKLMKAMASGLWILRKEWIEDSANKGEWLDESDYEASIDEFPGIKASREAHEKGSLLFDKKSFFIDGKVRTDKMTKTDKTMLIKALGGKISKEFDNCDICISTIYNPLLSKDKSIVSEDWLFQSITAYEMLPFKSYTVESPTKKKKKDDKE
eukprot:gene1528-1784_t